VLYVLESSTVMPGDDPRALPRVTLVGSLAPVPDDERTALKDRFLEAHPSAESYVAFGDFGWWRLAPDSVRFVGGYGRMSWVDVDEYAHVQPDPLARHGDAIMAHINNDHADANLAYARAFAGISAATSARMVAIDRLGFDLLAATPDGLQPARVNFDEPIDTPDNVRKAVVALLARARALLDSSPP
jgi:putative heme iron utilization protein